MSNKKLIKKYEAKQFFIKNKDKIYETAKFISSKVEENTLDKFDKLKNEYFDFDGTFDEETIIDNDVSIKRYLDDIRYSNIENIIFIGLINGKSVELYSEKGNQFSSKIDLAKLKDILKKYNGCNIYVVHNHPFIFRAAPSEADFKTLAIILKIVQPLNIELLDFAIVTAFDYWSMQQEIKKM